MKHIGATAAEKLILIGAPLAWLLQLAFLYGLSSYSCQPKQLHSEQPVLTQAPWLLPAVNIAALVVAVVTAWIAMTRRRTAVAGDAHVFLATWSTLLGWGSAAAIAFNTVALVVVPLCR